MSNWRLLIPAHLKVGGRTYNITHPDRLEDEGEPCDGLTDSDTLEIQLLAGIPEQNEKLTFVHEMLHAVDDFAALHLTEDTVERLAQALLMVLVDNELVDCIDCGELGAEARTGEPVAVGQVGEGLDWCPRMG